MNGRFCGRIQQEQRVRKLVFPSIQRADGSLNTYICGSFNYVEPISEGTRRRLILKKQCVRMWIGFIWPCMGFSDGLLRTWYGTLWYHEIRWFFWVVELIWALLYEINYYIIKPERWDWHETKLPWYFCVMNWAHFDWTEDLASRITSALTEWKVSFYKSSYLSIQCDGYIKIKPIQNIG